MAKKQKKNRESCVLSDLHEELGMRRFQRMLAESFDSVMTEFLKDSRGMDKHERLELRIACLKEAKSFFRDYTEGEMKSLEIEGCGHKLKKEKSHSEARIGFTARI